MKVSDLKPGRFFLYRGRLCMLLRERDLFCDIPKLVGVVVFDLDEKRDDAGSFFLVDKDRDVKYLTPVGLDENTALIKLYLLKCSGIDEGMEEDAWTNLL